jgi:hypothetical protein
VPDYRENYRIRGESNGRALLNEQQVREIRRHARDTGRSDLAEAYGVSEHTISEIIQRRSWAWLSDDPDESVPPQEEHETLAARPPEVTSAQTYKSERRAQERARARAELDAIFAQIDAHNAEAAAEREARRLAREKEQQS